MAVSVKNFNVKINSKSIYSLDHSDSSCNSDCSSDYTSDYSSDYSANSNADSSDCNLHYNPDCANKPFR